MLKTAAYHRSCQHRAYRLTCDQLDALWSFSQGCCQICGIPEGETARQRLVIDHAHEYGLFAVRGLLCDSCNRHMEKVDAQEVSAPAEVFQYRYNAWFLRAAHPNLLHRQTPPRRNPFTMTSK